MLHPSALLHREKHPFAIMGIVNVTPDSFYDGGKYSSVDAAVAHARVLVSQGADIIDIGGASSRPGAQSVPPEEEIHRVVPVIEAVSGFYNGPVSIDTTWSSVARAAIDAGATWINDISAGRCDPAMVPLAAATGCTVVLMHSRGTPETMQINPHYNDVAAEVERELRTAIALFLDGGVEKRQLVIDPGIGFAKTAEHNIALLCELERVTALGYPVLVGTSRKSFIGFLTGKEAGGRLAGTLASVAAAYIGGARIFRVHDAAETVDFLKVLTELI